jgi:hypothetical protein
LHPYLGVEIAICSYEKMRIKKLFVVELVKINVRFLISPAIELLWEKSVEGCTAAILDVSSPWQNPSVGLLYIDQRFLW